MTRAPAAPARSSIATLPASPPPVPTRGAAPAVTGRPPPGGAAVGAFTGAPVAVPAFPTPRTFDVVALSPALTAGALARAPPVASAGAAEEGAVTRAPAAGVTVVRVVTVFLLVTVTAAAELAAPTPAWPPSSMMMTSCFHRGLEGGCSPPGDLRSAAAMPTGGGAPGENLRTWRSWATMAWFPNCSRRVSIHESSREGVSWYDSGQAACAYHNLLWLLWKRPSRPRRLLLRTSWLYVDMVYDGEKEVEEVPASDTNE
ncbi:hypothetical protein PG985_002255 [Apiospora marii]|uniref:uncharacterized protein n=1 Tax=Apiospora marii TaxID=335849 RepID=UPI003131C5E7